jgi:hypothetical protein
MLQLSVNPAEQPPTQGQNKMPKYRVTLTATTLVQFFPVEIDAYDEEMAKQAVNSMAGEGELSEEHDDTDWTFVAEEIT